MKRVAVIGVIAAVTIGAAVVFGIMQENNDMQTLPVSMQYKTLYANAYEVDIPMDWNLQPPNTIVDEIADLLIMKATDGRMYDNESHEYAEPESLVTDVFPTSIALSTAKTDLTLDEYEEALFDIIGAVEVITGVDIRIIDDRRDSLDGKPAITKEYVVVSAEDIPTFKFVETAVIVDSTHYSISYTAELDDYDKHLHHFERVVETFRFK